MNRYIDADAFGARMYHEAFEKDSDEQRWDSGCWIRYKMFERVMGETPTADVAPIRHGTWTITVRTNVYGGREIICSECGEGFMVSPKTLEFLSDTERYCCRCGAKMDGDKG